MKQERNKDAARTVEEERASSHPAEIPPIAGDRFDLRLFQSLRRILRAVDIHSRKLSRVASLTSPQLLCLSLVIDQGSLTATDIARQMHLSPATVVGILDRLEARGLIKRARNERDRRRIDITATTEGHRTAKRAPSPLQDILAQAMADLPRQRQGAIARAFETIVEILEADHLAAEPVVELGSLTSVSAEHAENSRDQRQDR
ncbi:MarR family transcriptional regulator [candidate division GN15 bacterium]|nr:MarR family transcriptional regulator [candidate division GN15 bacterium]